MSYQTALTFKLISNQSNYLPKAKVTFANTRREWPFTMARVKHSRGKCFSVFTRSQAALGWTTVLPHSRLSSNNRLLNLQLFSRY